MSNSAVRHHDPMSVDQFLEFCAEHAVQEHWQLIDGVPVMMAGGSAAHSLIIGNLQGPLDAAARARGCRAMTSFFVRVSEENVFEPDLTIVCGPIHAASQFTAQPAVIVEVLSRSTMRIDRVLKFERYRALSSLQQIVFVYQDSVRVESWLRQHDDWMTEPVLLVRREDKLAVPVLGAWLSSEEIYAGVTPSPLNEL